MGTCKRGAFFVFEGCDRSGKSTQSRLLVKFLESRRIPVKHLSFPARETNIGKGIDSYLRNKQELNDEAIHLMFSANRWELKSEMKNLLEAGTTLVVDRYSYSGVAYSVTKGLSYEWCYAPEKGLLRPDGVFYLKADTKLLTERGSYGEERYEKLEFQNKVANVFNRICKQEKTYWHTFDASLPEDKLFKTISEQVLKLLEKVTHQSLQELS